MVTRKARISKRTVDAVPVPTGGEERLWDTDLKGFFLRVYPTGRRVYAVKYRVGRHQRILTIGTHGSPFTPETARQAADRVLRRAKDGEDPAVAKAEAKKALTVAELIDRYLEEGPATKPAKRASTWAIDRSNLNRHIRPLLGKRLADGVSKGDAARAVADITEGRTARDEKGARKRGRAIVKGGAGTARRTLITAAAMFSWGIEHGYVRTNPFASVRLSSPPRRERFLNKDEAARFLDALAALQQSGEATAAFADAVRLLLLTGARKSEVLGLRWSEVDLERKRLVLPPDRTKAGGHNGERRIALSPPALEILARRAPPDGNPDAFVFASTTSEGPIVSVRRPFLKVCSKAGVEGLRIHDLRHSFASFAVADGASLFIVSKLLGHASARTAERYAHLSSDPLLDVATVVGRRLIRQAAGPQDGQEDTSEGQSGPDLPEAANDAA